MKYDAFKIKMKATPLYVKVKEELIKMIKQGIFTDGKLPPENKLSEILGISRTTIREALIALNREGVITKKQGIGNLYHLSALSARMRLDKINDFCELLEDGGYRVRVEQSEFFLVDDLTEFQVESPIPEEKRYLFRRFVHYADEQPAIASVIFIPESILTLKSNASNAPFIKLIDFLNNYAIEEVSHSINLFKPGKVDEKTGNILNLKKDEPIIQWEEHFYGIFDKLLCFTRVIFHPELVNLTILRKWE
jgi:GntR family transcriptional regulator